VPWCGALSLLQKTPHYRGGHAETASRLNVKLCVLVAGDCAVTGRILPLFLHGNEKPALKLKADEKRAFGGSFAGVGLCFCTSNLASRCLARVARCPRPRHDRTCLAYCSRHQSSRASHRYSVPQPQAADQPLKPSAPQRRHCPRPQLVKGKSPQGSRVAVQIKQYLLYSAAQMASCSSPTAAASRLTSSMLTHVSKDASQLLKPASTPPRSYGRRHRSWHYEPQAQTNC
jgi:hypothetical protein